MKVYKLLIPSGTLEVCVLEECPKSFPRTDTRRLYLYPTDGADLECSVREGADVLRRASLDVIAALSYLLGAVRGLPEGALTVRYEGRLLELPKSCTLTGVVDIILPNCKYMFTKEMRFEGEVTELVTTVISEDVTRIVRGAPDAHRSMPLLRRTRFLAGLPDAVRAISYYRDGDGYRAVSTDRRESADSVAPLAELLLSEVDYVSIKARVGTHTFLRSADGVIYRCPVGRAL